MKSGMKGKLWNKVKILDRTTLEDQISEGFSTYDRLWWPPQEAEARNKYYMEIIKKESNKNSRGPSFTIRHQLQ